MRNLLNQQESEEELPELNDSINNTILI